MLACATHSGLHLVLATSHMCYGCYGLLSAIRTSQVSWFIPQKGKRPFHDVEEHRFFLYQFSITKTCRLFNNGSGRLGLPGATCCPSLFYRLLRKRGAHRVRFPTLHGVLPPFFDTCGPPGRWCSASESKQWQSLNGHGPWDDITPPTKVTWYYTYIINIVYIYIYIIYHLNEGKLASDNSLGL